MSKALTEYARFEFAADLDNITAGEKVRVVRRAALTDADQAWITR